jgi:hypothetical protein
MTWIIFGIRHIVNAVAVDHFCMPSVNQMLHDAKAFL